MKVFKSKITIIVIVIMLLGIVALSWIFSIKNEGPISVKSQDKLNEVSGIYDDNYQGVKQLLYMALAFPWLGNEFSEVSTGYVVDSASDFQGGRRPEDIYNIAESSTSSNSDSSINGTKDYSTTNVQVENVDEADVIKTDGNYIYSLSNDKVIITDVSNQESPVVVCELSSKSYSSSAPQEILLYNNKLIVISDVSDGTAVEVYDITSKENPYKIEAYSVNNDYYTSRIVDGKLYVFSTGYLDEINGKADVSYVENSITRYVDYDDIYYFRGKDTDDSTIISTLNLDDENSKVNVSIYLLSLDNLYVSENSMYFVTENYFYDEIYYSPLKIIFGLLGPKGAIKEFNDIIIDAEENNYESTIYKFNLNNGEVKYVGNGKADGYTIDQFSLDEYNSNLRVALYTEQGSKISVYSDKMKLIGESELVAKGERMYSSRFIGEKGYLVTYLNTDPLFCVDLSNPKSPEIIGELQLDGYSLYLHPYDENHLIGIGYDSEVRTIRNSAGKVTSTYSVITGMKMALFDVTNIKNPILMSSTKIGDSRTSSAILTNHKALLFSKEKGIIAIPVKTRSDELEISVKNNNIKEITSSYKSDLEKYDSEGYLVYNINLDDGFTSKGLINHDTETEYKGSNLIRGVYIKDYLYTVSQGMIKVNNLDTLEELSTVLIEEDI